MATLPRIVRRALTGIGVPIAIAFLVRATLVQAYHIPSGSMEDTLFPGDFVLAEKVSFGPSVPGRIPFISALVPSIRVPGLRTPHPGDLVIFESPEDPEIDLIKRCVAVAGQVVEVRNKQLFVDGQPREEAAGCKYTDHRALAHRDQFGPFTVPPGHFFAMGDNRDNSFDSRFFGPVPIENVRAHPLAVYFSWDGHATASSKVRWGHLGGVR